MSKEATEKKSALNYNCMWYYRITTKDTQVEITQWIEWEKNIL